MKKYKVIAKSVSYPYVIVKANNEEEALEIAEELDGGDFEEDWDGDFEILEAEPYKGKETPVNCD